MKRIALIASLKLSLYLKDYISDEGFKNYSRLIKKDITETELTNYIEYIYEESNDLIINNLKDLYEKIDANDVAITCIELAIYMYMDSKVRELFSYVCNDYKDGITVEIATKILYKNDEIFDHLEEMYEAYDTLRFILLYKKDGDNFIKFPMKIDDKLIYFIAGKNILDISLKDFARYFWKDNYLNDMFVVNKQIEKFVDKIKYLQNKVNDFIIIQIIGENLSGKKFLTKHISKRLDYNLLLIDYHKLINCNNLEEILQKIKKEILIFDMCVCFYDINFNTNKNENREKLIYILKQLKELQSPVFLTTDNTVKLLPFTDDIICQFEIPKLTLKQREIYWNSFTNLYLGTKLKDSKLLAAKMDISAGQIEKVVKEISNCYKEDLNISKICFDIINDGKYNNIKRIEAKYSWDDLKLEESKKEVLKEICNEMKYKIKVYDEWNLIKKYSYGRSISALFSGAAGTGKTMAAHVIANELQLELFKVDLSQVVDKYIGETEKRLEEIFQKAQQSNLILFFDEADSIFGKRSEVKDAKDKYANIETSYILQRIEEYDGIVLLATNYKNNIDPAFMRRIRYEISFSLPNKEIREEIWRSLFIKEVPYKDIDFDFLAQQFEFTGALIKNVMLYAAFKAASEDSAITMKHILKGVMYENKKQGKTMSLDEFGIYQELVK